MTNQTIIQRFLDDHHARFSRETSRSYQLSLKQFFANCSKDYDAVKASDIRSWLASMEEQGLKPRTIHTKLVGLKSFYQYCKEENRLKKDPTMTVHTPKKDDVLPYYLSRRQVALLQELTKKNVRDRAIVEALYATGVRISELLNIRLDDVKWETRQIWIRKGKGNKERFVLFTHDCAERLKTYLHHRQDESIYLFTNGRGGSLSSVTTERRFQEFAKELGFKVTPHTMRHTFAAHLAEKQMPQSYIQELLGHVNINSTRIYTRLMEHARKKQYDRYQ
ncbi:site-specific tyrosine recombinase/integron integrase [Tenuibacillus multivorans]|uniref:Integrase/recombinase XerD n=1 Tax=Tenuibacillus multivorans TaxID=237069 RepID=A0A1G9X7W1_9BACI|nr:site-specific tyrosine recombinase/integron integrase [Tenuibacillus multivorans]GEL78672.1 tyrosine recombinase XerC [Tenuibacillus multivorans]SDM92862.1 integrase/recombinase XerD [Tenuibacillus multivorans]